MTLLEAVALKEEILARLFTTTTLGELGKVRNFFEADVVKIANDTNKEVRLIGVHLRKANWYQEKIAIPNGWTRKDAA